MKRVLLVDDDPDVRDSVAAVLEFGGYEHIACSSAEEASNLRRQLNFDVIILDQMMPGVTGVEYATQLRSSGDSIPLLFLSADRDIEAKAANLSMCGVVRKPFDMQGFLSKLESILGPN